MRSSHYIPGYDCPEEVLPRRRRMRVSPIEKLSQELERLAEEQFELEFGFLNCTEEEQENRIKRKKELENKCEEISKELQQRQQEREEEMENERQERLREVQDQRWREHLDTNGIIPDWSDNSEESESEKNTSRRTRRNELSKVEAGPTDLGQEFLESLEEYKVTEYEIESIARAPQIDKPLPRFGAFLLRNIEEYKQQATDRIAEHNQQTQAIHDDFCWFTSRDGDTSNWWEQYQDLITRKEKLRANKAAILKTVNCIYMLTAWQERQKS